MFDKEQKRTTLPRVIVIAGATIFVSWAIISIVFLSHGNQSSLLPPWQLFVAEVSCIAILLPMSLRTAKPGNEPSVFLAAIIFSMVLTALVVYFWGVGHNWSMPGAIGTIIAAFLTLAYPILLSTIAILMMRRRSVASSTVAAVSCGLCLLLTVPMILVGVTLACGLAGDCL